MDDRITSVVLKLTEKENEFLRRRAEKACLPLSDFVLLSALALDLPSEKDFLKHVNDTMRENIIGEYKLGHGRS